jgi:holo-[acyl-carrier protein] synthase
MIVGMGIDAVEIERFEPWTRFSYKQLLRIFSAHEIDYCFSVPAKTAERLAARFAAKEAFFKALSAAAPGHGLSLLSICKNVSVVRQAGLPPVLQVNWQSLSDLSEKGLPETILTHLSITHTKTMAIALVLLDE